MLEHVDPFIGTSATDLPEPRGLAATWWWPKPQVGNTHLGATWNLVDEHAEPGYYRARLSSGITCELTVGPKSAVHRYTFPKHADARVVVDFSMGGLTIPYGSTVPLRAHLQALGPGVAQAETVVEGAPLAAHIECEPGDWRQLLWYDRRLMHGGTRLDLDRIRQTTLRPFGLMWRGRSEPGHVLELRFGFSLRGADQARQNLFADCPPGHASFKARRRKTSGAWKAHLGKVEIETRNPTRQTVFATALYHSLIKPCFAPDESPFWPDTGPFVFDICTMWDIYRTQLPLIPLCSRIGQSSWPTRCSPSARRKATCRSVIGWPRGPTASFIREAPSLTRSWPTSAS